MDNVVKQFKWVGTRPIRPDGVPKVTGRALYGGDYQPAGTLYGRIPVSYTHLTLPTILRV